MKVIDFENHFFTKEYLDHLSRRSKAPRISLDKAGPTMWYSETMNSPRSFELHNLHLDVGEKRIRDMDEAGIDIEVLSLAPPGIQRFEPEEGTSMAKKINSELARIVEKHPDRFVGLACVAPQEPEKAAQEIERCVNELGFRGVILHSHANNEYLDAGKYRPLFQSAAALGVPVYLHPELPSSLILPGFEEYGFKLAGTALGFAVDVALHSMRLIGSGLFDELPQLQVLLGHLGEGLPFWLERLDTYLANPADAAASRLKKKPSDYIKSNFTMLTSGMHYLPSFMCAYLALGADRIAFGTDFPYANLQKSVRFVRELGISDKDKEKILHKNVEEILGI